MRNKKPTEVVAKTLVVLFTFQLIAAPSALIAQSNTLMNTRREQAEAELAEANARKAEAELAKIRSDIAKQDIETRRAQIDALKTTSTVEGELVENRIAASKALGCAASNIAAHIEESKLKPDVLVLYSREALIGLSDYTALMLQLESADNNYPSADAAVRAKLGEFRKKDLEDLQKLEKKLADEIAKLKIEIAELEAKQGKSKQGSTVWAMLEAERKLLVADLMLKESNAEIVSSLESSGTKSLKFISTIGDAFSLAGGPASLITSAALTTLEMFKTDIALKGTDVEPGSQDLSGYLFRLLNIKLNSNNQLEFKNGVTFVSPDDIALSNAGKGSNLLKALELLSENFIRGKATMAAANDQRKRVIAIAEIDKNKQGLQAEIKVREQKLKSDTEALALHMEDPLLQAKFRQSTADLKLYTTRLEIAQKAIDAVGTAFDEEMSPTVRRLEALNTFSDGLAKRLAGAGEKDVVQKSIGDYLRSEVIYDKFNPNKEDTKKNVWWLEAEVSANGANQLKKSSPIIDIFTGGARISYSGGSVVSYQLRDSDGAIKLAGTVWSFAPYRKSSNIMIFECQDVRDEDKPRKWTNL